MNIETLTDSAGNILGYIEHNDDGSAVLKDSRRQIQGYYEPAGDHTRDAQRNIVAKGNRLRELIC